MRISRAAVCLAVLATIACQNESGPTHQYLVATVTATGLNVDASYLVKVDTSSGIALIPGDGDSLSVEVGQHTVRLDDIAANCVVIGPNPMTVTVAADQYATASFVVTCGGTPPPPPPPPGGATLLISATSVGGFAPASYSVHVSDPFTYSSRTALLPSNGTVSMSLTPGGYSVRLTVPSNCIVAGVNPLSVGLALGQTTGIAFFVNCASAPPPPPPVTLQVAVTTTGPNAPATYDVRVSDGQYYGYDRVATVPSNGSVGMSPPVGSYTVWLSGLSDFCAVSGASSRPATITAGAVTNVAFQVVCTLPAFVIVSAPTSGVDLPPFGYNVQVDGAVRNTMALGTADTLALVGGSHSIGLDGVPLNCTVSGGNPRPVTLIAGDTTVLSFSVNCQANPTLRVTATTTGPNAPPSYQAGIDPDYYGYAHTLTVASNGNASIKLPPGSHRVNLIVPLDCNVTSPNNVLVSVPLGGTTDLAFAVTCH